MIVDLRNKGQTAACLPVAGLVPFSTVDYPGTLSAVAFLPGCPWKCPYCHNAHLRRKTAAAMTWLQVRDLLERRAGMLEAVVFSGGEPLVHQSGGPTGLIYTAMTEAREMGFGVGLHTSGSQPEALADVLPLVDWVGLDIKAPLDERYERVTGRPGSATSVLRCLDLVLASGVKHQLRTTVDPSLFEEDWVATINSQLAARGAQKTVLQKMRPVGG